MSAPGEQGCGTPPALPKPPPVALEQVGLRLVEGESATSTDVEAIVEGVCRDSRKLIVSADDLRESGQDIAIAIPKRIRIAALKPGQVLKLTARSARPGRSPCQASPATRAPRAPRTRTSSSPSGLSSSVV